MLKKQVKIVNNRFYQTITRSIYVTSMEFFTYDTGYQTIGENHKRLDAVISIYFQQANVISSLEKCMKSNPNIHVEL